MLVINVTCSASSSCRTLPVGAWVISRRRAADISFAIARQALSSRSATSISMLLAVWVAHGLSIWA